MEEHQYIDHAKSSWKNAQYKEAETALEKAMSIFGESSQIKDLYDQIRADRSKKFEITQKKIGNKGFHLGFYDDSSKECGKGVSKEKLKSIEVRGWVAVTEPNCELLLEQVGEDDTVCKISIPRNDVVSSFKKREDQNL